MKKFISVLLSVTMMWSVLTNTSVLAYEKEITVMLNGKKIGFDVQPQIIGDRTMVPLRAIFEALGAIVEWDEDTQTVTSVKGNRKVILSVGVDRIIINGSSKALDTVPCIVDGRTLVPVRAISEAFDMRVDWDGSSMTVKISSEQPAATQTQATKSSVSTSSTRATYNKLKNAILEYGELSYVTGTYSVYFSYSGATSSARYIPDDDYCTLNVEMEHEDGGESSLFLVFEKENIGGIFTIELDKEYKKYIKLGASGFFEEFDSTIPEGIDEPIDRMINSYLAILNSFLVLEFNELTLDDLGINYIEN